MQAAAKAKFADHIMENDLLEALIALPEQLFYNTGIATYVWILSNRKAPERKGKVQLIDATTFWKPMRRSLGDKRREIPPEKADDVLGLLRGFQDGETRKVSEDGEEEDKIVSRIFSTKRFGYRRITVERPLRLNFQASAERIARLSEQTGISESGQIEETGRYGRQGRRPHGRALQQEIS